LKLAATFFKRASESSDPKERDRNVEIGKDILSSIKVTTTPLRSEMAISPYQPSVSSSSMLSRSKAQDPPPPIDEDAEHYHGFDDDDVGNQQYVSDEEGEKAEKGDDDEDDDDDKDDDVDDLAIAEKEAKAMEKDVPTATTLQGEGVSFPDRASFQMSMEDIFGKWKGYRVRVKG
jgi:hypothetical protein